MSTFVHVKNCTKETKGGAFAPLFCVRRERTAATTNTKSAKST